MKQQLTMEQWKSNRIAQGDEDAARADFLEALDASDLLISDWEIRFVESYLQARSEGRGVNWFTDGRRESCDKMMMKYGAELGTISRIKFQVSSKPDLNASPGCCMYLVSEPGHPQRPCNEPATCQTRSGFRYCEQHRQIAAEACRRKKVPFSVTEFINRQDAKDAKVGLPSTAEILNGPRRADRPALVTSAEENPGD